MDISVSILIEFWQRNLVNLFSTPLKISEWILGTLLHCLLKLVVTLIFSSFCVYLLYSLNVFTIGWQFIPFAALLLVFGWTTGFIAASAILYWGHKVETLAFMFGMLFAPFSAVYYPVSVLPLWAQKISWSLPTTYIFEGMREILSGRNFPYSDLWMSLGLSILYLLLSIALFHYSFSKTKEKGLSRLD